MTCASHFNLFNAKILALVFVFCACTSVEVQAQVAGGTISGTIRDSRGKEIPTARVSIRNVATDLVRNVDSNSEGYYIAPNLLPATYEITVSAQGFNTSVIKDVELTVGAQQTLDLVMRVGTIMTTVQVTTEAPTVQLSTSDISEVVNANTARELPLNGRSWTDLATLQPGVNAIRTQVSFTSGDDRGNRGFGQQLTISGARPQQNNYRLDGVSLNDYANGAPGSVLGGKLGVDAIEEFSVLTSNYSAEYGKTSGGVINAITRPGTNQFHGSVYEFARNSALDTRNFFDSAGAGKASFQRNQFGGTIGGPIVKDHTFFFADYEGNRQSKGIANIDFLPSPTARTGAIHDSNGNPITVTIDPLVQKYLALYPIPKDCGGDVCSYNFNGQQVVNENFVTTRIDQKLSDKDSVF